MLFCLWELLYHLAWTAQLHCCKHFLPVSAQSLRSSSLQEELFCQLANQTWCNTSRTSRNRGWLLLALLSGCAHPSPRLEKYLIK